MVVSTRHASGLATAMVLSAQAHFSRAAKAFLDELTESQPALKKKLGRAIPDMIPKAYRWVGEMEEISSFITSSIFGRPPSPITRQICIKVLPKCFREWQMM
ncbi:hypothetical protein C366_00117 [Cryptococcus neoformans Tu401-1]|nr:hypothetical protein C366_00117 [Cryptococcus neoformans var. grubii Tu401-1]